MELLEEEEYFELEREFIDDFESSKRTTQPVLLTRQWKRSSKPVPIQNLIDISDEYIQSLENL